jgi:DNA adenine methylase
VFLEQSPQSASCTTLGSAPAKQKLYTHEAIPKAAHLRSPLIYAGNKAPLAAFTASLFPSDSARRDWVEPFVGSAGLLLNAPRCRRYILSDINHHLTELLLATKDHLPEITKEVKKLFNPDNNCAQRYAEIRQIFNTELSSVKKSAAFLYLNRHCFNGVVRCNRAGAFNTAFGRRSSVTAPIEELKSLGKFLAGATKIETCDFEQTLAGIRRPSIVLMDSPYLPSEDAQNCFTGYAGTSFGIDRHNAIANWGIQLSEAGHHVFVFNNDSAAARRLHSGAQEIHTWPAYRKVSRNVATRGMVQEFLAVYRPR